MSSQSYSTTFFSHFDLLSVGIAIAAIGIMGFVIYFNDRKNVLNQTFLALALTGILWSVFNYLSYQFSTPYIVLWLLRFAIFFAVWFSFFIFKLFYIFPNESKEYSKIYKNFFVPLAVATSIINLTPFVFQKVAEFTDGRVSHVINGPGIALFGIAVFSLVGFSFHVLIKKIRLAKGPEKKQSLYIFFGVSVSSLLLIIFNFLLPAFLGDPRFVIFGAVFLFPFIALTSYAIFRHRLFDVKIVATELLTFVLSVVVLIEVILSRDIPLLIFRMSVFLLVLSFGILLIKSVRKEIRQRELLQALDLKLERANRKLKILDQARAEFITMASHQLRTPPATIKWYLAAILGGDFGLMNPDMKEALRKTQSTNNALISLIDDMLNVSRIERGKLEFVFEPTDILKITQFTIEQLMPMAEQKHLKLELNPSKENLPPIVSDKEKLRQVINNLIDNAIKYTKVGKITVSLSQSAGNIIIKVSDTGKGMPIEEQKKVFQKYGRGLDANNYSTGLGLGLYLAKVVVETHNGKIWAESRGSGKGSTFFVSLPLDNKLKVSRLIFDLTSNQS